MRSARLVIVMAAVGLVIPSIARAQSVIDGTLDSGYNGALRGTQLAPTQFGDSQNGSGGSELDAAYSYIQGTTLYLMLTGNLEGNYNKLDIFLQTHSGGTNVIPAMGGDSTEFANFVGMKVDSAFLPNYILSTGYGGGTVYANLANLNAATESYIGNGPAGTVGTTFTGGNTVGPNIVWAVNNSNNGGVTGSAADPAAVVAVTTGIELSFDLTGLGWDGNAVEIMAGINGSGDNYFSNQFIGSLPANYGNLGNPGAVDFTQFGGGPHYFTVPAPSVPEPSALGLLAAPAALLTRRSRRS